MGQDTRRATSLYFPYKTYHNIRLLNLGFFTIFCVNLSVASFFRGSDPFSEDRIRFRDLCSGGLIHFGGWISFQGVGSVFRGSDPFSENRIRFQRIGSVFRGSDPSL